jgi:RNA recognition motif-containing protein
MEEVSESKVYVGNLPFSVGAEELKKLFAEFGEIAEATVISDKFSGRSKGFGFVTFANKEDAEKAVAAMNEKDVQGRALKVSEAKPIDPDRPRPERRSFGDRQRRY